MPGASEHPRGAIELAADAAMKAAAAELETRGAHVERMVILIESTGLPDVETCVIAGRGFEDAQETVAFLLVEAQSAGRAIGLNISLHPVRGRG